MAEDTPPENPGENPKPPEDPGENPIDPKDYDKMKRKHDWALAQHRVLTGEVDDLRAQIEELQKSKLPTKKSSKDNNEDLSAALEEIDRLKNERESLANKVNDLTVKQSVLAEAQKAGILPEALTDFWGLNSSKFVSEEDEKTGEPKVAIKGASWKTLSEYFEELRNDKPYFFSNQRKPGGNLPNKGSVKTTDLDKMDRLERIKALRENPQLRNEQLKTLKLPHS